ncbi:MAG: tetratricopeptide repeat protein [Alistipes sp.]|jgi:tetratricopeptide (TPR) repeat protein|nr:tetratricopeptide repeat protein [Alistipes sp.]
MAKAYLQPTSDQTFRITAADDPEGLYDFRAAIDSSRALERAGDIEGACNVRFQALRRLYDLLPEGEETILDWGDEASRAAVELAGFSAIDHFLVGDWEMAAGIFELVLEIDPEDHLEATTRLAYVYLAMGELESFDEIVNDISDKFADRQILLLWSEWRRGGTLPEGSLIRFKTRFEPYFREFTAAEHPVTPEYLADIDSDRPTPAALARELWLQTEHLWTLFPDFIQQLKA